MDILEEVYKEALSTVGSHTGPTMTNKVIRVRKAILKKHPDPLSAMIADANEINGILDTFYAALGESLSSTESYMLYLPGLDVLRMRKDAVERQEPAYYGITLNNDAQQIVEDLFDTYKTTIYDMFVLDVLDIMIPRMSIITRKLATGYGNIMLTNLGYPYLWVPLGIYLREQGLATASYNLSKITQDEEISTGDPYQVKSH